MKLSKVYQPRIILVKDEDGDMLGGFYSILFRWKNYFCQLLNVHYVRQTEIYTAEPLVPEPGFDQILAELIQDGGKHYILEGFYYYTYL